MKRRAIPFLIAAALVAFGAAWWWEVGRPQQQAFEMVEILSGRDMQRIAFDPGWRGDLERLIARVRGRGPVEDALDRQRWALDNFHALAQRHPSAVLRAAELETDPSARMTLASALADTDAFRDLPPDLRLEETLDHVCELGPILSAGELDTLRDGRAVAVPRLHAWLRGGKCGALNGLRLLDEPPAPGEIAAALAVNPSGPVSRICEKALARQAAP